MLAHSRTISAGILALAVLASPAGAQTSLPGGTVPPPPEETMPDAQPPPGHVASVDGPVVLERGNQTEEVNVGLPVMVGDRLRTDNGSVDVTWADSTAVRLARFTEMDVLSPAMVRVPRGTVTVSLNLVPGQSANETLAIDAPGASVRFLAAGQYRVSVNGSNEPNVELAVISGSAQLISDRGQLLLAAGEKSSVTGGGQPSMPVELSASANDASTYDYSDDVAAFQRSSGGGYQSTQYLPSELYGYASVLDSYGSWESDASYGYVWYPRVSVGWRPYYQGQWRYYRPWGWTWIGADRWSWPTHHYGRWGIGSRGWFWIPARHWGPAWVSWAVASDYVGWCPLGWDGRPVVGYITYNNAAPRGGYTPWRGWTVLPSGRFDRHDVARYRVDRDVLLRDRPSFITQNVPPRGIPRNGVPIATSGSAIPRSGTDIPRNGASIPGSFAVPRASDNNQSGVQPGVIVPERHTPGRYRGPADADSFRNESPYDRARRVMDRRMDSPSTPSTPSNTTPETRPGMSGPPPSNRQSGAGVYYGVPRNAPRNPTPGMSGPPSSTDPQQPQPGYAVPRVHSAPGWNRGDDRSSGFTPRSATPPPTPGMSGPPTIQRGPGMSSPPSSGAPSGVAVPRHSGPPPAGVALPPAAAPPPPPPPPPSSGASERNSGSNGSSNQGGGRRHP